MRYMQRITIRVERWEQPESPLVKGSVNELLHPWTSMQAGTGKHEVGLSVDVKGHTQHTK